VSRCGDVVFSKGVTPHKGDEVFVGESKISTDGTSKVIYVSLGTWKTVEDGEFGC
jgi:hypothetical protein